MHLPSKTHRAIANIIALMMCMAMCVTAAAEQGIRITTAPSMTRVMLVGKPSAHSSREITIEACRNDVESAQVIISGLANKLSSFSYRLDTPKSSSGSQLPAPSIYQEYDVLVKSSSPHAPLPAGLYPDVLVPFSNGGSPMRSSFKGLDGDLNLRLWIDFHVPKNQQPGTYETELHVTDPLSGVKLGSATIKIVVRSEALPDKPSLKTYFGLEEHEIARIHGLDRNTDGVALAKVMDRYYQLMIDARVQPGLVFGSSPPLDADGQLVWKRSASDTLPTPQQIVKQYFGSNKGFNCLHLPMWRDYPYADPLGKDRSKSVRYLAELARLAHQTAPDTTLFFSVGRLDEPDSARAYQRIRDWASLVHEAAAKSKTSIKFFVTEQPQPQDAGWGTLTGSVDIWAPQVMVAWEDLESKKGNRAISKQIKAGDEVWCYPALAQFRDQWKAEKGMPDMLHDSYPPVWLIDYPAIHYRILPWICAAKNISGIHYWNVFKWPATVDPWNDAGSFVIDDETFNGDGLLIYPPPAASVVGEKLAAKMQPCASIRLKWIRDGIEDYDHLQMLKRHDPKSAEAISATIAKGFADWETSPSKISRARESISRALASEPLPITHPPPDG
ncbi:hypothetical protein NT6N_03460 [Oceaniferula spumae]|uniref:Glycoside hydrolase 123 catalytic domain-containing protein n=1 Tax=Oceaniferula spumae TaxID=2979115 RepID=A0AAT9FH37_9BACT